MIKIQKIGRNRREILINGEKLQSADVYQGGIGGWSVFITDPLESKKFFPLILNDIDNSNLFIINVVLDETVDRWLRLSGTMLVLKQTSNDSERKTSLVFKPDFDNWISPFSAVAYLQALKDAAKDSEIELEFAPNTSHGFSFECVIENKNQAFLQFLSEKMNIVRPLSNIAAEEALRTVRKNSLVTWFNFPAPIKTSCEQYLIYFVQFLEDLGIKANSEIKEDAGRILFSVTPADGPSALGKIKEALEAYLDLPRNPEFNTAADELSDMAVSQLKANVFFLKSQLAIAQAVLEAKDATIEALKLTTYQQRQMLTGSTSGVTEKAHENESEPILGDTVHLTKFEGKFLKVDMPTILRRLKRSFGIDKDKE